LVSLKVYDAIAAGDVLRLECGSMGVAVEFDKAHS
jgi:hypothetical protein